MPPVNAKLGPFAGLLALASCASSPPPSEPYSVASIDDDRPASATPIEFVRATDGTRLAYRTYAPSEPEAALVFYHGGGAHSGAGYPRLARALADDHGLVVITPDLRGHGQSGGPRGDSRNTRQVLRDVDTFVALVRRRHPTLATWLGGHSSGAGLLLNHVSFTDQTERIRGYALLAPHFGFRSETERPDPNPPFAEVSVGPFVLHSMSFGLLHPHTRAVRFNYSAQVLEADPGMVGFNTVAMANALTPRRPGRQLAKLSGPVGIWIGASDELLDPEKVRAFVDEHAPRVRVKTLPHVDHLGIISHGADALGGFVCDR